MPSLSVIVPIFNAEKYIHRCVESILNQTYKEIELVLVDDGSTDSSAEICDNYAAFDQRVKVIHTVNQGAGAARDTGLNNASPDSEFIAFVDSDDWTHPELYERLASAMLPDTDIAYCDFTMVTQAGQQDYKTFSPGSSIKECISNMLQDGYGGNLWNKLIRRRLIEENGLRFRKYVTAEDILFISECFVVSSKVAKVESPLYFYNLLNEGSLTRSTGKTERRATAYIGVFEELKDFLKSYGWGNAFEKELCWRIQLLKSDWVLQPDKYGKYHSTWPESRKYTLSNPFLHKKMKAAMWMLDHHITLPLRLLSLFKNKMTNEQ